MGSHGLLGEPVWKTYQLDPLCVSAPFVSVAPRELKKQLACLQTRRNQHKDFPITK